MNATNQSQPQQEMLFDCLPNEVLHMVLSHLSPKQRDSVARVAMIWSYLIKSSNPFKNELDFLNTDKFKILLTPVYQKVSYLYASTQTDFIIEFF